MLNMKVNKNSLQVIYRCNFNVCSTLMMMTDCLIYLEVANFTTEFYVLGKGGPVVAIVWLFSPLCLAWRAPTLRLISLRYLVFANNGSSTFMILLIDDVYLSRLLNNDRYFKYLLRSECLLTRLYEGRKKVYFGATFWFLACAKLVV